jgi:hypothetical protein
MKMMRRKIIQGVETTSPDDWFKRYLAMSDHQLEHLYGNLEIVFSARLALSMKKRNCLCPLQERSEAFMKLRHAILLERPVEPEIEQEQEQPTQQPEKEEENENTDS